MQQRRTPKLLPLDILSPKKDLPEEYGANVRARTKAQVVPTSENEINEPTSPNVLRPRESTNMVLTVLRRPRASITPGIDENKEPTAPRPFKRPASLHRALRPDEEYTSLCKISTRDQILRKGIYHEHTNSITTGTNYLVANDVHNKKNQAAIIMARENALLVAQTLKSLKDAGIKITKQIRLALVRAGENTEALARVLAFIKDSMPNNYDLFIHRTLHLEKLAEIFANVDQAQAQLFADLLSTDVRHIVNFIQTFYGLIDKGIKITDEMIVSGNLRNLSVQEEKRSLPIISTSPHVTFQNASSPGTLSKKAQPVNESRLTGSNVI